MSFSIGRALDQDIPPIGALFGKRKWDGHQNRAFGLIGQGSWAQRGGSPGVESSTGADDLPKVDG
jgi:hypothetical protein